MFGCVCLCVGRESIVVVPVSQEKEKERCMYVLCVLMWWLQRVAVLGFVVSADVVRRAHCIVGKENL